MTDRIENGVEWFETPYGTDGQCARCGSSIGSEHADGSDGGAHGGLVHFCLSSAEWCQAHPLAGRESQTGAAR